MIFIVVRAQYHEYNLKVVYGLLEVDNKSLAATLAESGFRAAVKDGRLGSCVPAMSLQVAFERKSVTEGG